MSVSLFTLKFNLLAAPTTEKLEHTIKR